MSYEPPVPENALVLVADAGKALFFRNAGKGRKIDLATEKSVDAPPNPRPSAQGTDRPGKTPHGGRSSAMEETDWARQNEAQFAVAVAGMLDARVAKGDVKALVLVASPTFLGDLRRDLSARVRAVVFREIDKDFAHATTAEIERALTVDF